MKRCCLALAEIGTGVANLARGETSRNYLTAALDHLLQEFEMRTIMHRKRISATVLWLTIFSLFGTLMSGTVFGRPADITATSQTELARTQQNGCGFMIADGVVLGNGVVLGDGVVIGDVTVVAYHATTQWRQCRSNAGAISEERYT